MRARVAAGASVQTPFGKGVVREVRNSGRLLVDVQGRAIVLKDAEVSVLPADPGTRRTPRHIESRAPERSGSSSVAHVSSEVDLHGMTVEEALARAERALNDALLTDRADLRFIHGRSGGRIRGALHRWLAEVPSVRAFRLDPHNPGVTIVSL
jgi:dsDNA-specific endonuclease/ATPase MutS2